MKKDFFTIKTLLAIFLLSSITVHAQYLSESYNMSKYNNSAHICTIYYSGINYGNSIWLSRKSGKIKAKYFAYKGTTSVAEQYNEWKKGKQIILYCSGAYTTEYDAIPVGLTINDGNVVNRKVDTKMDGLVVVEAIGGVRIANLRETNAIYLQSLGKSVNPRNNPTHTNEFIAWAKDYSATVFQTNLLYFKNTKYFSYVPASAERRLLVLATNKNNNELYHIIYNIPKSVSLTIIAEQIFYNLYYNMNMDVTGMINLDTGARDIFQMYDEYGKTMDYLKGPHDLNIASNLLVYYYE